MRTRVPFWFILGLILVAWPISNLFGQSRQNDVVVFNLDHSDDSIEQNISGPSINHEQNQFFFASLSAEEKAWIKPVSDSSESDRPVGIRDTFPLFDGDRSLADLAPISDDSQSKGLLLFVDYDAFRGVSDGAWENNGIRTGFNYASRLGQFSDLTGIGAQVGASVGIYDWAGTDYRAQNQNQAETQGFITYGFYRKPTEESRFTGGVVQDWSFNDNFGVFGKSPSMSQIRSQLGYAVSASNEFGIWGTAHVLSSTLNVNHFGPTTWRSVNQLSGYWHHKWFAGGPDTWISVGVPSSDRLAGGGSLGDYLVSASSSCPLSNAVALTSSVTYMHQSGRLGGDSSNDEAWNFTVGISIYPGRNAVSSTVAGQRWMPLMPVANNGTFLVDASQHY